MNIPVKKIELVLPKNGVNGLLDILQSSESLEIISENETDEDNEMKDENYKLRLSEVNFTLTFLEEFKPKENFAKNLIFSFVPSVDSLKEEELKEIVESTKVKQVVRECAHIEEKINTLESRKEELVGEVSVLEKFSKTSVFLDNGLTRTGYFAGSIETKKKEEFLGEVAKKKNVFLEMGEENSFICNFVLFYPKDGKKDLFHFLDKYNTKEEDVFWEEEPKKALEKRRKEISEINIEVDIQKKEAQKLLFFLPKLRALADWLSWQIDKEEFLGKSEKTKKYVVVNAWVPEEDVSKVKEIIEKETQYFLMKDLPIKKEDNPPVVIKNEGVTGSFGIVTGVYGLPKRDEIDPTPYLAPFFIFYFALALSDSGYGILLASLAFLAKKVFRKSGAEKFFNLFIFSGILTAVVGLFVGTVFGSNVMTPFKIADPLTNPIGALMFVLALGVFQIIVGLIIGMIWLIKSGKVKDAISGNGASLVFFAGGVLFLFTNNINFIILGAISMAMLAFIYAEGNGVFQKVGKALGALYGLIGYVGDILSYSRILALGLATGIIAMVINTIALIFKDMIPIPGIDLMIAGVILVVGHIGNLLINALGAFIHSARLQFVEFFSKFMEGGGRYFKPLAKKGRFIKIIN